MNRREFIKSAAATSALCLLNEAEGLSAPRRPGKEDYQVGAYYFPQWHPDRHNDRARGKGWTEWEVLKAAKPRFPGHHQPRVPAWGYLNEADPKVMEMKIDAAADHGVDFFIFDWYWNEHFRFLHRALEHGYFGARNNPRVKFCCMWVTDNLVADPGPVFRKMFNTVTDFVIEKYFKHPSHFKIDGRPYFCIYELSKLLDGFGDVEETQAALSEFRQKTRAAGFPGLHLNATPHGIHVPLGSNPRDGRKLAEDLGFDSLTSYAWVNHVVMPEFPETEYNYMRDGYFKHWDKVEKDHKIPFFPNVTMGWDASPRTDQSAEFKLGDYPYIPVFKNSTPAAFREALRKTKSRMDKRRNPKIVTIYAWNEWTEGGYLEPDTVNGMAYLEAIRDVFGP